MHNISTSKRLIAMMIMVITTISASAQVLQAEAEIQGIMRELTAAGMSVAVVKKNKIIYTHSFGVSDMETQRPLTDNNIFRIASISKSFSATSIMQLIEAKKCSLDDDFSQLVGFTVRNPKFPDVVITLRMVMSHTSSVNDSQGYFTLDAINPGKNPNFAKCYNTYKPGNGYEYCNLNYNMVGAVIERLSGERFDQYVKHHILDPLDLYGGYCVDSLDNSRFAKLYEYEGTTKHLVNAPLAYNPRSEEVKNYVLGYSTPIFSPTGGMKISATDLAKYMMMHMNYGKFNGVRIISKKSSKIMQTKVSDGEGGYGLALRLSHDLIKGKELVGHTGSSYGLTSGMFFQARKKFGIVVICNGSNQAYYPGSDDINILNRKTMNVLYKYFIK
ncbi:MAG: serine hydrolase domain-containing protein [Pedobacter sp.]